jgi:hypothetical protein
LFSLMSPCTSTTSGGRGLRARVAVRAIRLGRLRRDPGLGGAPPWKSAEDPDRFIDFVKDGRDVLVELSTGEIIGVNNPDFGFPTIRIWIGQITTSEMKIEQTLLDTGMAENKTLFVPRMMVSRLNDTGTHKQFQVDLL